VTRQSVEELLAEARGQISRFTPADAQDAIERGAILIDIRPEDKRAADGAVPGARIVPRNVLEWRVDPSSEHRNPELARRDIPLILMCDAGYQSSLAAATLRRLGVDAGDLVGGFQAWREAGLPITPPRRP
jgi:rhodanese-related sulfurtransferase